MKRIATYLTILVIAGCAKLSAQPPQTPGDDEGRQQRWRTEMRNYKHEFLTRELDLDKEQQKNFFADYDEMEDRINALNIETRELEQRVMSDEDATDAELEAASRKLFELKSEESKIELEYFDKFKAVLSPKQLIRLKNAERKFTQQLVKQHRRLKSADPNRRKQ